MAAKYACLREEKDKFWTDLDEVMESIPKEERLVIGGRFQWACWRRKQRR